LPDIVRRQPTHISRWRTLNRKYILSLEWNEISPKFQRLPRHFKPNPNYWSRCQHWPTSAGQPCDLTEYIRAIWSRITFNVLWPMTHVIHQAFDPHDPRPKTCGAFLPVVVRQYNTTQHISASGWKNNFNEISLTFSCMSTLSYCWPIWPIPWPADPMSSLILSQFTHLDSQCDAFMF
jgi:hypothetical protein